MRWFILLAGCLLPAADFNGIWIGQIPTRAGQSADIAFQLVQNGNTLRGKLYGDYTTSPIVEGKIAGELVTFVVVTQEQAGNQINETRIRFSGKLQGDELELVRVREAAVNAGTARAPYQFRENPSVVFRLKKLL